MATTAQDTDMGMTKQDRIDKLYTAEAQLACILATLDTASEQCNDCGHKRYSNWDEKQAAEAIQGAIGRVEKARRFINEGAKCAQGDHR